MATFVPLLKALKTGIVKSDDFVYYEPDELRKMYCSDIDGFATKQLGNELGLGWHPVIYKGFAVLLIADKVADAKWTMSETTLHDFGKYEEYFKLYENKELGSLGIVPTEEIFREIPERLKKDDVLTYSPSTRGYGGYRRRSMTYNPAYPHDHRYSRSLGPKYYAKKMQPIVALPYDTMIDIDDKVRGGKSKNKSIRLYSKKALVENGFSQDIREFYDESMWISIKEALTFGRIQPTDFVNYMPDESTVVFSKEETGAEHKQTAKTEYTLEGWHPIVLTGTAGHHLYLVSRRPSKFELAITSKVQYRDGTKLLEKYAQLYNNKELDAKARSFNESIFDEALKHSLVFENDVYWLACPAIDPRLMGPRGRSWIMPVEGLKWIARSWSGRYVQQPTDSFLAVDRSIRIAVSISDEIMVEINNPQCDGSCEEKALNLKRKTLKE